MRVCVCVRVHVVVLTPTIRDSHHISACVLCIINIDLSTFPPGHDDHIEHTHIGIKAIENQRESNLMAGVDLKDPVHNVRLLAGLHHGLSNDTTYKKNSFSIPATLAEDPLFTMCYY